MQSRNYRKLNKSLRQLTEKEALEQGARAALRALPFLTPKHSDTHDKHLLAAFRGAIVHAAAFVAPSSDARFAARTAALSLAGLTDTGNSLGPIGRQALAATNGAARAASVYSGRVDATKGVADASTDAIRACCIAFAESEKTFLGEAASIDPLNGRTTVFEEALFPKGLREQASTARSVLDNYLTAVPEKWAFWRAWYAGYIEGKPLPWELQARIALLPEEVWHQGPLHVAGKIEELIARDATATAISQAEKELQYASSSRHGIGGNNPPEAIEQSAISAADELFLACAPLEDIKEELDSEVPNEAKIRHALQRLQDFLNAGLFWAVGKADLAVDTTIKWGIPAVGGGYFALNPDKIEAVIVATQSWLTFLH